MKMLFTSLLRSIGRRTLKTLAPASTPARLMAEARTRFEANDLVRVQLLFEEVLKLEPEHAATLIRGDGIDILVDFSGHLRDNRLMVFARKPAPARVTYPAYPNTTGMSAPEQGREHMRTSPLSDARGYSRALEAAYHGTWRNWCGRSLQ